LTGINQSTVKITLRNPLDHTDLLDYYIVPNNTQLAQDWIDAAKSDQNEVVKLRQLLDRETTRREQLEHKLELFMQRVEANEGIDLRAERKGVIQSVPDEALEEGIIEAQDESPRRGRPRKV
jgi:hypothetical protein